MIDYEICDIDLAVQRYIIITTQQLWRGIFFKSFPFKKLTN